MGRPKEKGAKSEMDEMLDEALGADDRVDADSGPEVTKSSAADDASEREESKASEPERAEAADSDDDDPEPIEAKPDPAAEVERERTLREAAERQSAAIRRELVEMRAKLRSQSQRTEYAPNPSQPAQEAQAPIQPEKPLSGEDLIRFQNGQIALDVEKIRRLAREEAMQATMPDPRAARQQQIVQDYNAMKDEFVRENPQLHSHAMSHAEQAYEFLTLASQAKAQEWGLDLGRMNFDGRMDFLNTSGVMNEVAQRFPHLAPELPELLRADALESREGMRTVLRRYAQQLSQVLGGSPATAHPAPSQSRPVYQPPTNPPPDLSKVGTGTPEPARAEKERLAELEKRENADPLFGISAGEAKELSRLRQKLGLEDLAWGVGNSNHA